MNNLAKKKRQNDINIKSGQTNKKAGPKRVKIKKLGPEITTNRPKNCIISPPKNYRSIKIERHVISENIHL